MSLYVMAKTIRAENKEMHEAELPRDHRSHCLNCRKQFNLLRRKVKCTTCGEGFCKDCTDVVLSDDDKRTCHYCFNSFYKHSMNTDCSLPTPTHGDGSSNVDNLSMTVESFYKTYYATLQKPPSLSAQDTATDSDRNSDDSDDRRSSIPIL
ncbi:hypothetical protein DYB32_007287 [Aphanomyces invadans]|uniref:FYVE-type domain-containing protein n=1 Tax=Aphanomyces invadans TaxID=157072 RepID=A0A418ANW8_9STRA|nr:hypothetical protein DYB32_007287 [Aphanomyces invadans]